jgi:glucose-6-phosphate 1-dehydrogenase
MKESKKLIVVLGGTGDLMQNKIAPSLYYMLKDKKMSKDIEILGCGRSEYTSQSYFEFLKPGIENKLKVKIENNFAKNFSYLQGDLNKEEFYKNLKDFSLQKRFAKKEILFYLSISPTLYKITFTNLHKYFKNRKIKIIVEKPFGLDEASAKDLNKYILKKFDEKQIFRVEHYLAKDILKNLSLFRKDKKVLGIPLDFFLNKNYIKKININIIEMLSLEKRGPINEVLGVFRDMGQNHQLQILALLGMDLTSNKNFANNKESFLQDVSRSKLSGVQFFQYETYRTHKGVDPESQKDTAFEIDFTLENKRYTGVKVCLKGGKEFASKEKYFSVHFQNAFFGKDKELVKVVFFLDESKVQITYKSKDKEKRIVKNLGESLKYQYVTEYAKLFEAGLKGDKSVFVSFNEIESMWKFADKVLKLKNKVEFYKNKSLPSSVFHEFQPEQLN